MKHTPRSVPPRKRRDVSKALERDATGNAFSQLEGAPRPGASAAPSERTSRVRLKGNCLPAFSQLEGAPRPGASAAPS
ncbi:MAG: hypothetical protein AAFQ11_07660, partial [Pseudomonadota bacterium]